MTDQEAPVPAGIAFTPFEDRLDVIERGALLAEQLGLSFVSVAEATGLAAPIALAQLAWRTERVGLMTGSCPCGVARRRRSRSPLRTCSSCPAAGSS